jgi:WD40 repeat protein
MRNALVLILTTLPAVAARSDEGEIIFRVRARQSLAVVSPDGKIAAIAGDDRMVHLFHVATRRKLKTLETAATSLAIAPDGRFLAVGSQGVALWDIESGRSTAVLAKDIADVRSLAFRADGKALAIGAPHAGVRVLDVASGNELAAFDLGHYGVTNVAISPNGKLVVAGGSASINPPPPGFPPPTNFRLWNVETKKPVLEGVWLAQGGPLLFSPDGKTLGVAATGGPDLWDVATRKSRAGLRGHHGFPQAAAFSFDGALVATGCEQGVIKMWDVITGRERTFCRKAGAAVRALAFADAGKTLVSVENGNGETVVRAWRVDDVRQYLFLPLPDDCFALGVGPGARIVLAATDAGISRWDLTNGMELPPLKEHQNGLDGVTFSADGTTVATLDRTGELRLWDAASGKVRLRRPKTGRYAVALSADGAFLAVADGNIASVLSASDGKVRMALQGHRKQIIAIAFSPDGRKIVTAGQDQELKWWNASTGKGLDSAKHGSALASVAISPDGKLVASGAEDGTVKLWNASTHELIATLEGHEKTVRAVAFGPDGAILASGSADGSCRLWDVPQKKLRVEIRNAGAPVGIAFLPNGKTLLTAGASRTVQFWDPVTGAEKIRP